MGHRASAGDEGSARILIAMLMDDPHAVPVCLCWISLGPQLNSNFNQLRASEEALLQSAERSCVDAEQLMEEALFSFNAGFKKDALQLAHHAHDLDSFECGVSRFH